MPVSSSAGLKIEENVALAPLTTFRVGGPARWFARVVSEDELTAALHWAKRRELPAFLLGGGSNLLVADAGFDGLIVQIASAGIQQDGPTLDVAAGENWDALVSFAVGRGLAGMECLAGIPGSVGATPVQNVGAYGQEVAQTIRSVRAFDRLEERFVELSREDCRFRYRASLFNTDQPGRYAVTRVRFELYPGKGPELRYADLQRHFAGRAASPSLEEVAEAVRSIRRSKGMVLIPGDPDTQSAGSYFKNPVLPAGRVAEIAEAASLETTAVPAYPAGEGCVKLSAAWLVEKAGFPKGFRLGAAGLSTRHTLALTNRGGATCADILRLEEHVRGGVAALFGAILEREPVLLGACSQRESASG